ncbi:MAG: MaoC family dehydratase [Caulobacterales bacterium]|nr:MaoC family dehydratase [Caulobacterales bacterium]
MTNKAFKGNFFEDFKIGAILHHATPRTITEGDFATYIALSGSRYPEFSSKKFAQDVGFENWPIDPLLLFHIVFGKTVPDISLNAVANLGYAECKFHHPVKSGDSITSVSEVIGLKENSNGKTGVVYVRTKGFNQFGDLVLSYVRWVMVNKGNFEAKIENQIVPELKAFVEPSELIPPCKLKSNSWDIYLSGSPFAYEDYEIGEKIDHRDAMAIEEAEHQMATRLYQNTARVHFDAFGQKSSKIGRRLVYGGVVISTARAIAFNGLGNAGHILAINAGRHVNPFFAGDTIYAWSQVLDKCEIGNFWGALRLKLIATKDLPCDNFPHKDQDNNYLPNVILDLDYWVAIPLKKALKIGV